MNLKTYQMELIWSRERSRDCTRDKASRQRDSKTWWRCTTATLLDVSFGSYRRRHRDVLMERGGYVPLRRLGDVPLRRHWVFHLRRRGDVLMWCCHYVPMRRHQTYQQDVLKAYHWDVLVTYQYHVIGCFIWDPSATSMGRTERPCYDVATTSCCRVGWVLTWTDGRRNN